MNVVLEYFPQRTLIGRSQLMVLKDCSQAGKIVINSKRNSSHIDGTYSPCVNNVLVSHG